MNKLSIKNDYVKLIIISFLALIIDYIWLKNNNYPPAWDQGFHLSNVFKMNNIFNSNQSNIIMSWNNILDITDSYRGPLTYFISASLLKFTGNDYTFAFLSNNLFNILCIISIYNLGKILKNKSLGIWASIIFTFSPFIMLQRTDYLIDLSLAGFSSLFFLFLTNWYLEKNGNSVYSFLSGISLGLIFLVKPTGILLFIIPILFLCISKIRNNKIKKKYFLYNLFVFIITFFILIFPWFSRHWITIISSTINAYQWGLRYQNGLDSNTLEGWFYYFKEIPTLLGNINFILFFVFYIFQKLKIKRSIYKDSNKSKNLIFFWYNLFFLNGYLILSFMTTKDIRFILPIYPIICIYFALIISNENIKKQIDINQKKLLIIFIIITITIDNFGLFNTSNQKLNANKINKNWFHDDIIKTISEINPEIISTLAVIPDTREINTFNLEAEAAKQGETVAVRQIISNIDSYKDDLIYFDWFLLKDKSQGIMKSESKKLLTYLLLNNPSFIKYKEWKLPDGSSVFLMRRKNLTSNINEIKCTQITNEIVIKFIGQGLNISFDGKGKDLNGSQVLIDVFNSDRVYRSNMNVAQGLFSKNFQDKNCYSISQNTPILLENKDFKIKLRLLSKNNKILNSKEISRNESLNSNIDFNKTNTILLENKIDKVNYLGYLLKNGNFEELFNLVGILNQSDPKQRYLESSEKIYKHRFNENKNVDNLYALLVSEILQKKIKSANDNIDNIIKINPDNKNLYLVKSIIKMYLLNPKQSFQALQNYKLLNYDNSNQEIVEVLEKTLNLLNFKIFSNLKFYYRFS